MFGAPSNEAECEEGLFTDRTEDGFQIGYATVVVPDPHYMYGFPFHSV